MALSPDYRMQPTAGPPQTLRAFEKVGSALVSLRNKRATSKDSATHVTE
jgi:hypothetical protein